MPGLVIGRYAEIGACSQVRHNVPDNEIWYGNPAKFYKKRDVNTVPIKNKIPEKVIVYQ
jgi:acetyltransferase-like isoleucine patch superfamily enzyme